MAELNAGGWTAAQTRGQFAAIAWLRWRILRERLSAQGRRGEMAGIVLLSLLLSGMVLGVCGGGWRGGLLLCR